MKNSDFWIRMIYLLAVMIALTKLSYGQDFQVSETGHAHFYPSVAADSTGKFIVVWSDTRSSIENGGLDSGSSIYGQRFLANGSPIGINFRVNETVLNNGHWVPKVSMNEKGDFIIVWEGRSENRSSDIDIFARRYDKNGIPVGSSFKVNDDRGISAQIDAKLYVRTDGSFIITWLDRREGPLFSYAQIYDSTGIPVGKNFKVNINEVEGAANIDGFKDGRFFFMWSGYLRLFSANSMPFPGIVNIGKEGSVISVGMDSLLVFWGAGTFPNDDIFIQIINTSGLPLSESIKVDQDDLIANPIGKITVSCSRQGGIIVVWQDHRNDPTGVIADGDIYAQRYNKWLVPIGANFKVNHEFEEQPQRDPAVVFSGNNFVVVWTENQTQEQCPPIPSGIYIPPDSVSIMATIQSFENPMPGQVLGWQTKHSKCLPPIPPSNFLLYQNYPNPFNAETIISFDVAEEKCINITIYDLLGRCVQQLVSNIFFPGKYNVKFESNRLSSGVYFYKLSTDTFNQVKKMIMIR